MNKLKLWLNKIRFTLAAKVLRRRVERALSRAPAYRRYLEAQITKSVRQANRSAPRTAVFIAQISRTLPLAERGTLLAVGCRNAHELDALAEAGFKNPIGIDLFSKDARIKRMDMHLMDFPDAHFDALYSCHSLEHSFNFARAVREFARVVRSEGILMIEVPVRFASSATDRVDFGSAEGLRAAFAPYTSAVLFCAESTDPANSAPIARLIARRT